MNGKQICIYLGFMTLICSFITGMMSVFSSNKDPSEHDFIRFGELSILFVFFSMTLFSAASVL